MLTMIKKRNEEGPKLKVGDNARTSEYRDIYIYIYIYIYILYFR